MKRTTLGRKLNKPRGHIVGARWHGLPAKLISARVVTIIVGDHPMKDYWARPYVGLERRAIEITVKAVPGLYEAETFYLDDHKADGVYKLTVGQGKPEGFRQVFPERLVEDDTIDVSYGFLQK